MPRYLIAFFCCATASWASAADTVVVCPGDFLPALRPWLEHRAKQGHSLQLLPPATVAATRASIQGLAAKHKLKYVVLVGDAEPSGPAGPKPAPCVATSHFPAKIIRALGPDTDIASDNEYGDLDGDGVPDLAVGRLSADSPGELQTIVRKIIAHERPESLGDWSRKIHFVAGVGGFGFLADAALESCAKRFITSGVPAAYGTTMTYANWRSPYCPDPRRFGQTVIERLNEGSLFWVYIGHGYDRGLDYFRVPGDKYFPIFNAGDVKHVRCPRGAPFALFLACSTGAFDKKEDCLAEDLLRQEGGPVAVLSGSRTTMPYAMGIMAIELMRECFIERRETIGEILLRAKRSLVLRPRTDDESRLLDWLAATLSVNSDLAAERAEHVLLFNLLGDPLSRVPHAARVKVAAPSTAQAGDEISITGQSDLAGRATVELVVRRDQFKGLSPMRLKYEADDLALTEYQREYGRANDHCLASTKRDVPRGDFRLKLRVPDDARGACHVRVFVQGAPGIAMGAADVNVKPRAAKDKVTR